MGQQTKSSCPLEWKKATKFNFWGLCEDKTVETSDTRQFKISKILYIPTWNKFGI